MTKVKREEIQIDPTILDEEILRTPDLFCRAVQEVEEMMNQKEDAEDKLEELHGRLTIDIAKNPANYGLEKTTESAIKAALSVHKDVINAKSLLRTFKVGLDKAKRNVAAIEVRKHCCSDLVDLYEAQYFAIPNPGRILKEGKRLALAASNQAENHQRSSLKNRFKVSDHDDKTDEEKLESIKSPEAKAQVELIMDKQKTDRTPRRRRK